MTRADLEPEEEFVPEDDAIIGQAFKWSALAIGGIVLVILGVVFLRPDDTPEEVVIEKDVGAIDDLVTDVAVLPEVAFSDVTSESGIDFVHCNGAQGEKLLPETMGGGAAFFDYDDDGDVDLLFVNGAPWPHDAANGIEAGEATLGNALFQNDGTGHFTNVTEGSGLEAPGFFGMGAAVGDYDGDGQRDVFLTGVGGNRLFRNVGGRFEDVTSAAGVAGNPEEWTTSAGFFDADGDDDLDLFVCHYVRWSREIDSQLAYTLNGTDRAYGPPTSYEGSFSTLYRNEGDGTFTDVSEAAGIHIANPATGAPMGKALGVTFADFDLDGHTDVVVANDTIQNHFFRNKGDGTFDELGALIGIGFDGGGQATGAMGIDVGDFRADGSLGVCIANFANEMSSLFVAPEGTLRFSDDAMGEGIGSPSRQRLSFGLFFLDYDLDGRLDLLQVNGHLEESINEVQPSQHYLQPPQLFWNAGPDQRSCYMEVPPETAGDLDRKLAGRGSAYADIDGDGDTDAVLVQVGEPPVLLRNDQALGHRWLRIQLAGRGGNRDGIGAWVVVETTGGETLRRQVATTRSYLSQSELPLTFGLGSDDQVKSIEVQWPDGERQSVAAPGELNRLLVIERAG